MKVYLDLVFFVNFGFDFLLLLAVDLILKRKIKIYRVFLGSLLGSLSIFFLFLKISSFILFFLKAGTSILMILTTFGKKGFFKNLLYLYTVSIFLGGFLYFINLQFSYKNEGFIFFYNGFHLNLLLLLLLSPIILYIYYKESRYFEENLSNIHTVTIYYQDQVLKYRAYLDTGNKLYDSYKNRPVTILYDKTWYENQQMFLPISFETLTSTGFLKGVTVDKIKIDDKLSFENVLLGLTNQPFALEETNLILHSSYQKELQKN